MVQLRSWMIPAEACPGTFVTLKGACGKTTTTTQYERASLVIYLFRTFLITFNFFLGWWISTGVKTQMDFPIRLLCFGLSCASTTWRIKKRWEFVIFWPDDGNTILRKKLKLYSFQKKSFSSKNYAKHCFNIASGSEANITIPCEMEIFNFLWLIWDHYLPLFPT